MTKYSEEFLDRIGTRLQEYIVLGIKEGLKHRMNKQQIKDTVINSMNVKNAPKEEWDKFRKESGISNIFEDVWDYYFMEEEEED